MSQLRDELSRVQAEGDRFERRLSTLEVRKADADERAAAAGPARSSAAPVPTPPNLRVVRLSPEDAEQSQASGETVSADAEGDPNDARPRPSIRVHGSPRSRVRGADDRIEETLPPEDETPTGPTGPMGPKLTSAPAPASRPSALDPDAKRAYDAALALVNGHEYARALEAFAAFIVKWPDHPNTDNAMYWRGECYFAQGEYARAAEQFEGVLARFPLGNKVPDSLLKLGISQQKLGNSQVAKSYFEKLQREYPRSEAARRIPKIEESK